MAIGCLALEEKLHLKTPIVNYPLMAFDNPLYCSTLNAHRFGNSMKMKEFFNPWPRPWDAARRLYVCVVKQARQPGFYLTCGVPDTADGRFADISAVSGFDFIDDSRALAVGDWDGDGDLDMPSGSGQGGPVMTALVTISPPAGG